MEKDISGNKYGRLTAIKRDGFTSDGHPAWIFLCDCGNYTRTRKDQVTRGKTLSCGCLMREISSEICKKRSTTHGMRKTRIYKAWDSMKYRCNPKNTREKEAYYDRGIRVCDEWKNDFMAFYHWAMENGYDDSLTLDRIDNDGIYEPNNCRWATAKQQANNRRKPKTHFCKSWRYVEWNGEVHTLIEWSRITGISYDAIKQRYERGDRGERLFREKERA